MKVDILAIGVHPDDVELGCGGTLSKLIHEGKTIAILDLTAGELGTRGNEITRKNEADEASKILGINTRENLKFRDGFFKNDEEHQLKIINKIRKYQPQIVLCNAEDDRHPDHSRAAKLVSTACFLSGLLKIKTIEDHIEQDPWRPNHIFHYIQWKNIQPHFVLDITGFLDQKVQACLAYKTQFYNPNSHDKKTPISSKNFMESISYRAKDLGRLIGTEAAEGYTTNALIGVKNFELFI